jgi:hypothetical protein
MEVNKIYDTDAILKSSLGRFINSFTWKHADFNSIKRRGGERSYQSEKIMNIPLHRIPRLTKKTSTESLVLCYSF